MIDVDRPFLHFGIDLKKRADFRAWSSHRGLDFKLAWSWECDWNGNPWLNFDFCILPCWCWQVQVRSYQLWQLILTQLKFFRKEHERWKSTVPGRWQKFLACAEILLACCLQPRGQLARIKAPCRQDAKITSCGISPEDRKDKKHQDHQASWEQNIEIINAIARLSILSLVIY